MAQANASVLGQAQMNVAPSANGSSGFTANISTHVATWVLLGILLTILFLHYVGSGGIRGSVAS